MSKINSTYSSGYYIAPDVDFRKLEEQQRQEKRGKRKHDGAGDNGDDNVKRQTFAIPFDLICEHCQRRIARGSHVYANRRATDKRYLDSIRIWELEILCRFCKGKYYLLTDPETPKDTGGYICDRGCKRVEGDFYSLNKQNQAARAEWERAKEEAELNPLAALEKENEAVRELEERNRQIEEAVEKHAGHDDRDLLAMLRNRPRRDEVYMNELDNDKDGGDANGSGKTGSTSISTSAAAVPAQPPSSSTSPPLPSAFRAGGDSDSDGDGTGGEGEADADERALRAFNEDTERRWRILERQQRARQRQQEQQSTVAETTMPADEGELTRVLARYGGDRRVTAEAQGPDGAKALDSGPFPAAVKTSEPAVAPMSSSGKNNKFFVHTNDHDDDSDSDDELLPTRLRGSHSSKPPHASVSRTTRAVHVTSGAAPFEGSCTRFAAPISISNSHPSPRKGGSFLLRRLADEEEDESGGC
ncbi:hypothetical protein JKF63_00549 [Porcisia hertigi]|uniref:Coiled-coil domain-containing protein 94 n=1 Tax=Porcisia hertigi TaxID=2761500 RepID=A0A836KX93_9TRYP|nr:hypothetical protein JKF63_00549 [Porcisia hertigi]